MQQQEQDTYDYRQYDRIWQRVSPTLDPYPGMPADGGTAEPPAVPPAPAPSTAESSGAEQAVRTLAVGNLPGTEGNPCCMGASAMGMIRVLQGFIEEALAAKRYYLAFSRQAPGWARQALRDTAEDEEAHARTLMAVHYLITCQCYQPASAYERIYVGQLCPALRARYHEEACSAMNYARAAESTADPCLAKLLNELSEDEYRHAERMLVLLERGMRQQQ